jgi:hypothetical protein
VPLPLPLPLPQPGKMDDRYVKHKMAGALASSKKRARRGGLGPPDGAEAWEALKGYAGVDKVEGGGELCAVRGGGGDICNSRIG